MSRLGTFWFVWGVVSLLGCGELVAKTLNGFELQGANISPILKGGPPRDGIPALLHPIFSSVQRAKIDFGLNERVIVVQKGDLVKVYPISILNWHEIVNDTLGGEPIVVTYCPLCGTGVVFHSGYKNKKLTFGVSGLLYQSDVLLYDHQTESLWSQIMRKGVTGTHKDASLRVFPSKLVMFKDIVTKHPKAQVLSLNTGYDREYNQDPYAGYERSNVLYFDVHQIDRSVPLKTWTLFVEVGTSQMLVPISVLPKHKNNLSINVSGQKISITYNIKDRVMTCRSDEEVTCMTGYWFALKTFYPKAKIYK